VADERDMELRRAALDHVRRLSRAFDDIVPVGVLKDGFRFRGERISLGSFYSGIYKPRVMDGPAALTLTTAPPKLGRDAPYDDGFDEPTQSFVYHYRTAQSDSQAALRAAEADNRALRAAFNLAVPVIYFHGIASGQYTPVAPVFITRDEPDRRVVHLEAALPLQDVGDRGLQSDADLRRYATREARVRLHQHRFRELVLSAYSGKCAVCSLRESALLQAAHIIEDRDPRGAASVVNGIALCAIHHLAYDRNLLGIDPTGVVHIASRLLEEIDGPMLSAGLQSFHGAHLFAPRRQADRPDPVRLEIRYEQFRDAS
jgi:putative restriction endonuclease